MNNDDVGTTDSKTKLVYSAGSVAIPTATFYLTYFMVGQTILISSILSAIGLILILQMYIIRELNKQTYISNTYSERLKNYHSGVEKLLIAEESNRRKSRSSQIGDYELYIAYNKLDLDYMGRLSILLNEIYLLVYTLTSEDNDRLPKNFETSDLIVLSKQLLKAKPEDILIVKHAETGNSFSIILGPNWKLSFSKDGIELDAPRGFKVFVVTMILLSQTIDYGTSQYKKHLETKKLEREIELLEIQLREKQKKEEAQKITKTLNALKELEGIGDEMLQEKLNNFLNETIRNDSIKQISIKHAATLQ